MPDYSALPSRGRRRYLGPERRQVDRAPPAPPKVIGRVRVRPERAKHASALERGRWYNVVEQAVDVLTPHLQGYGWI